MGVIQREIERGGIPTVSISLIREFSLQVRPPRALWVPFPFGRPLGAPNDAEIQRRVLCATLALLERPAPVLEEFVVPADWEYLDAKYQTIGRSCGAKGCSLEDAVTEERPLAIPAYDRNLSAILAEIEELSAAHRRYRDAHQGRTQVGQSGVGPETIASAAETVHRFITGGVVDRLTVRLSIDDLKAFYLESRLGVDEAAAVSATAGNDWLWLDTRLATMLVAARDHLIATTDKKEDPNWVLSRGIVPRGYAASGYALTHVQE